MVLFTSIFPALLALASVQATTGAEAAEREPSKSALTVGMLFVAKTQFLDTGPMDILAVMSSDYVSMLHVPKRLKDMAIKMNLVWISETGEPVETTSKVKLEMTVCISRSNVEQPLTPHRNRSKPLRHWTFS
jgi:hypothetical protein